MPFEYPLNDPRHVNWSWFRLSAKNEIPETAKSHLPARCAFSEREKGSKPILNEILKWLKYFKNHKNAIKQEAIDLAGGRFMANSIHDRGVDLSSFLLELISGPRCSRKKQRPFCKYSLMLLSHCNPSSYSRSWFFSALWSELLTSHVGVNRGSKLKLNQGEPQTRVKQTRKKLGKEILNIFIFWNLEVSKALQKSRRA